MSADQLTALIAAASADPEVAARFAEVTSVEDVVAVAAELGFELSVDEVNAAGVEVAGDEVSDVELATAAGGYEPPTAQMDTGTIVVYHPGCH
ncbi:MAG: Nif11-like leader peptide family RiPP precursor [Actinomycetes bacterium]